MKGIFIAINMLSDLVSIATYLLLQRNVSLHSLPYRQSPTTHCLPEQEIACN